MGLQLGSLFTLARENTVNTGAVLMNHTRVMYVVYKRSSEDTNRDLTRKLAISTQYLKF